MKFLFCTMISCFLFMSCGKNEKKSEHIFIPQEIPKEGNKINNPDGYYLVKVTNVENSCDGLQKAQTQVWDFLTHDKKSGLLVFNKIPYNANDKKSFGWDSIEMEFDETGYFKKIIYPEPYQIFDKYFTYRFEVEGQFFNDTLKVLLKINFFIGSTPAVEPDCNLVFNAFGQKRYYSKTEPAKILAGEYKTTLIEKSGTCPSLALFENIFSTNLLPQGNDWFNINMGGLEIHDLPISGQKTGTSFWGFLDEYTIKGDISPESFTLTLDIYRGFEDCTEGYVISGVKRFAEADSTENTIDGAYLASTILTNNTCEKYIGPAKQLLDIKTTIDNKIKIYFINKIFVADIEDNNFYSFYQTEKQSIVTASKMTITQVLEGTVLPNTIAGKYQIILKVDDEECFSVISINGQKLYKHL